MAPKPGFPHPHGCQAQASSYLLPKTFLISIPPLSHSPGHAGIRLSPQRTRPFPGCGLFGAGSSLPILHTPRLRSGLGPQQPRSICRRKSCRGGGGQLPAYAGHLGEQNRPGGSLREREARVPGDDATEELLWPGGHSSPDAGDLDFYVKYTKF